MMPNAKQQVYPQTWNEAYAEGFFSGLEEARRRIAICADGLARDNGIRIGMWHAWRVVFKPPHRVK